MGNHDVIGPGDVQWMTAARGIIHEEYHSDKFTAKVRAPTCLCSVDAWRGGKVQRLTLVV